MFCFFYLIRLYEFFCLYLFEYFFEAEKEFDEEIEIGEIELLFKKIDLLYFLDGLIKD